MDAEQAYKLVKPGGTLVVTVRPVEFWPYAEKVGLVKAANDMLTQQNHTGFAFVARDSRAHYGEAGVAVEGLSRVPGWRYSDHRRPPEDPRQVAVVLERVP